MVTVTLSSFKGGTGKSSLTILLGNAYAASGRRVLTIDLDHQQNVTRYHATDLDAITERNIAEAFHRETLDGNVLPSHVVNTDFVAGSFGVLKQRTVNPRTLTRILEPVRDDYDVCIVDCPGTVDNIVLNGWYAADRIVTPARQDGFDLLGIKDFQEIMTGELTEAKPWTIVLNFYRTPRTSSSDNLGIQMGEAFTAKYSNLSAVRIPETVTIERAVHGAEMITTAKRTRPVYDAIVGLATELLGEPVEPKGAI